MSIAEHNGITNDFSKLIKGLNDGTFSTPRERFDLLLEEFRKIDEPFNVRLINWICQSSAFNEWCSCKISENPEIKINDDKETIKQFLYFAFKNNLGATFDSNKDALERNIRNWLNQEDYSLSSSKQRRSVFQWAFALKQTSGETITMFNKLFAQPAFIREPETLIFFYCLDKKLSYDEAADLIQRYEASEKPTEYIKDDVKNTNELYLSFIDAKDKDDFLDALVQSSNQFEITNKRAKDKIVEIIHSFDNLDYATRVDDMADLVSRDLIGEDVDSESRDIDLDYYIQNDCFDQNLFVVKNLPLFLYVLTNLEVTKDNAFLKDFQKAIKEYDKASDDTCDLLEDYIIKNSESVKKRLITRELEKSRNRIAEYYSEVKAIIDEYTMEELIQKCKSYPDIIEYYEVDMENSFPVDVAKRFCQAYGQEFEKHPFHKIPSSFLKKAFSRMPGYDFLDNIEKSDSKNDRFEKYNKLRKMLILLCFFEYFYEDKKHNTPFEKLVNRHLYECSFAPLYEPNAFDFAVIFASHSEKPIRTLFDLWCYAAEEADKSKKK